MTITAEELRKDIHEAEEVAKALRADGDPESAEGWDRTAEYARLALIGLQSGKDAERRAECDRKNGALLDSLVATMTAYKYGAKIDGMQLVPVEPTLDMLIAGQERIVLHRFNKSAIDDCEHSKDAWGAMLEEAAMYFRENPHLGNGETSAIEAVAAIAQGEGVKDGIPRS